MEVSGQFSIDRSAPRRARGLLDDFRDVLDDDAVSSAALVVSELVANCVRHGGREGHIRVCLRRDADSLAVWVSSPTGTAKPHLVRFGDRLSGKGGIGLRIVDRLASRWGVHDGESQTTVWAELPAPA